MGQQSLVKNKTTTGEPYLRVDTYRLIFGASRRLDLAGLGQMMTEICQAVDRGDRLFFELREFDFIEQIAWKGAGRSSIPTQIRNLVFALHGRVCSFCGSTERIEIDHKHPWSKGGTHDFENLQPLCKPCNRRKGANL